jgi:hypothetical protein
MIKAISGAYQQNIECGMSEEQVFSCLASIFMITVEPI